MIGDHLLDLVDHLALCRRQPLGLGLGSRDPRQLAHGRECQLAARQRRRDLGQRRQTARHAHPLARRMRRIAEHALHVLVQGGKAVAEIDLELFGSQQIERFRRIERR
ncbi:MAG TPA: hypothetical protein VGD37_38420, partial [Kofleriaceae bacterium]